MKIKPHSNKLYGIVVLYEMHTDFLVSALEGLDKKDVQQRLGTQANHIAWLTGSIINSRFELAKIFNIDVKPTTGDLFKDNHGIIDDATYPTLTAYKKDWKIISPLLQVALTTVTDDELKKKIKIPGMEFTLFEMISFNTYREANCIGQIALWRRLLGYPAMKYM